MEDHLRGDKVDGSRNYELEGDEEHLEISVKHYGIYLRFKSYDNLRDIIQNCQEARKNKENEVKDVVLSIGHLEFELTFEQFLEVFPLRPKEIRELLE